TSTYRIFVTYTSGLCRLLLIVFLLHVQNHTSRWTRSVGLDQYHLAWLCAGHPSVILDSAAIGCRHARPLDVPPRTLLSPFRPTVPAPVRRPRYGASSPSRGARRGSWRSHRRSGQRSRL